MLETFYAVTTQVCFTLLGLWWVVVEFKHREWMADARWRRMAYNVSLSFVLPGVMSMVSLLAVDARFLWRIGFGVAGLLGAFETAYILRVAADISTPRRVRISRVVVLALYLFVTIIAAFPELAPLLGIGLSAIAIEGLMVALLMFFSVNFAWTLFAEPSVEA